MIYAVALTHAEHALVLRAVREFAERTDSPLRPNGLHGSLAADVLAMLENAIDERGMAEFGLACEEVAP
jgi:hypothetical protein